MNFRLYVLLSLVLCAATAVSAQTCPGDLTGDRFITRLDLQLATAELFVSAPGHVTNPNADANADAVVSVADVSRIVTLLGANCRTPTVTASRSATLTPTPTATPSRTASAIATPPPATSTATATRTITRSPTITATIPPSPTATPTIVCAVRNVSIGTTNAELAASDCQRLFQNAPRYTDVYQFVGTPGQAVRLDVTPTGAPPMVDPFITLVEQNGQFDRVDLAPPAEFVVASTKPYTIYVTTKPLSTQPFGTYQLTLTARPCPTPRVINPVAGVVAVQGQLDATDCPDTANPVQVNAPNPVDLYTFTITDVPQNIYIEMQQLLEDGPDPSFSIIGPDGFEILSPDALDDAVGGRYESDAGGRFLALRPGIYTIVAQGGMGPYRLIANTPLCFPKRNLTNIPTDRPVVCGNGPGCPGTLYGDRAKSPCGAPLPQPGAPDDLPEPDGTADLYTFTAQAGDVISVELSVPADDAHLFLLGPESAGNPIVVEDDDGGPNGAGPDAQLAATLVRAGKYTIVATVNSALLKPSTDPTEPDPGDAFAYTLFVQKCPVTGALQPNGSSNPHIFAVGECQGFGGIPFHSYELTGTAGQFVTVTMTTSDNMLDPYLRLIGPDGRAVENDQDPFAAPTTAARVSRILPTTGSYFVEASSLVDAGSIDLTKAPAYTLAARSCPVTTLVPGTVSGNLQDADCDLGNGRRADIYGIAGPGSGAQLLNLLPPANTCTLGLTAEGPQLPDQQSCTPDALDVPLTSSGRYGVIVAGAQTGTRGPYSFPASNCPMSMLGLGETATGVLSDGSCRGADDHVAERFFLRGTAPLVLFNDGLSGTLSAGFPLNSTVIDRFGPVSTDFSFADDGPSLLAIPPNLGLIVKISGANATDRGSFKIVADPAATRQ